MATLSEEPARDSLQVAPLAISSRQAADVADPNALQQANPSGQQSTHTHAQMTPPATPNGSQEDLIMAQPSPPPVFHNFLRAFYPFHPSYAKTDSTVTLPLNEGDLILVHSIHTNGWADGTLLMSGARGWLPTNYCEAYDPEEMRNLLKALLNFWDLLRSTAVSDNEIFGNQEFMKGIIAGVRYLLERTHCLTRESALIQRHDGLRRGRKSLLSELSALVKTAKRLQEVQRAIVAIEHVNDIVDEMILKAFKIVVKGVRFLDVLEEDRRTRAPAVTVMATVLEEAYVPPTPPADSASFEDSQAHSLPADAVSRAGAQGSGVTADPSPDETSDATQANRYSEKRLSLVYQSSATTNTRRLSQNNPLLLAAAANRLSSSISHRVSLAGPPATSSISRRQNLVSERLELCYDTFLSYLGSLTGRLQFPTQELPQLALATKQSATSGGQLLFVVDVVCAHGSAASEELDVSRAIMYDRIRDLVDATRDILRHSSAEVDGVIMPQENGRLLMSATGCVKATGECVAKTKWVIEKIGDFEFEFDEGRLDIDLGFDLDSLTVPTVVHPAVAPPASDVASIAESTPSEAFTATTATTTVSIVPTSVLGHSPSSSASSINKPLPMVPVEPSVVPVLVPALAPTSEVVVAQPMQPSRQRSRPTSLIIDETPAPIVRPPTLPSPLSSTRPSLPPLPKISTSLLSPVEYSPSDASAGPDSDFRASLHAESVTASSSGTSASYLSRDSESGIVSQSSTRATTPDHAAAPKTQPSLSDMSIANSSTVADEDDVETRLNEKTYYNELMFNKDGQVTGGSLPALVERLTTHESTPDAMFVSTFYLTFRLFCTPIKLAEALIHRFDYVGESPHMSGPVRLRVYNVFKGWLESHWRHESDHEALALIRPFADHKLGSILPSAGRRLIELCERVSSSERPLVPRLVSSMGKTNTSIGPYVPDNTPLPPAILSRSQANLLANWKMGGTCPSILDLDPLEMARQITLRQMKVFCAILPEELLGSQWMKKGGIDSPHVKAMTTFSTDLSNLVADTILQFSEVKKRAAVIKQWIKVAQQCLELHNYDALMAIICSLNSSTITRLRRTWDVLSAKRRDMLQHLQAIVEPSQNNKVLRARLHGHVPPCLPFLGMFLTDLTFVDIGNPATKTNDQGLTVVNYDKHTRTAKIIGELQRFQIPYRLAEVAELQEWLGAQVTKVREMDAAEAGGNVQVSYYRKSLLLEPREQQGQQMMRAPMAEPMSAGPGKEGRSEFFGWMRSNSNAGQNVAAI